MADEITVSVTLEFTKSGVTEKLSFPGLTYDMSGTDYVLQTQTIGTSEELLLMGDITTPGYLIIKNLDSTNFVELYRTSAGSGVVKLKAGETACFRLSAQPYALADTASCQVQYLLIED